MISFTNTKKAKNTLKALPSAFAKKYGFKIGDKVKFARSGVFGWEEIDEAEHGGYDMGNNTFEVTEVDYTKGEEAIKLNFDNQWVHPKHFDLASKFGNGGGVAISSESGLAVGTNADLMMNQNNLQYADGGGVGKSIFGWLKTSQKKESGDKIISIAKKLPFSNETETDAYPISGKVPIKFYKELGIKLNQNTDYVLVLEIQFDTRKVILQIYDESGETDHFKNYGIFVYNVDKLSKDFQEFLINEMKIKDIKVKHADGGNMSSGYNYSIGGL